MNIRDIRPATISNFDIPKFKPEATKETNNTSAPANAAAKKDIFDIQQGNWQQDILLTGLDALENKMQLANSSSPLDKVENRPIETFAEAVKELSFIKSDTFKQQASAAQANISPDILINLLTEAA